MTGVVKGDTRSLHYTIDYSSYGAGHAVELGAACCMFFRIEDGHGYKEVKMKVIADSF